MTTEFNPRAGATGPTGPVEPKEPAATPAPQQAPAPKKVEDVGEIAGMKEAMPGGTTPDSVAMETKAILAKQEKQIFIIPLDPGEMAGKATRTVTINGYRFEIKKGVPVSLPMAVVAQLMDSYNYEAAALNENPRNLANADEATRRNLGV